MPANPVDPAAGARVDAAVDPAPSSRGTPPAERLLNLVIALVNTNASMTKQQVRAGVAGYGDAPSTEAFERMFERDKDTLRALGIPIVTVDAGGHTRRGRVPDRPRRVRAGRGGPDPGGAGRAVALAAQFWRTRRCARTSSRAMTKLRAAGRGGGRGGRRGGPGAAGAGGGRRVRAALEAISERRDVSFTVPGGEHGAGADAARGAVAHRGARRRLVPGGLRPGRGRRRGCSACPGSTGRVRVGARRARSTCPTPWTWTRCSASGSGWSRAAVAVVPDGRRRCGRAPVPDGERGALRERARRPVVRCCGAGRDRRSAAIRAGSGRRVEVPRTGRWRRGGRGRGVRAARASCWTPPGRGATTLRRLPRAAAARA